MKRTTFSCVFTGSSFYLKGDWYVKLDQGQAKSMKWNTVVFVPQNAMVVI